MAISRTALVAQTGHPVEDIDTAWCRLGRRMPEKFERVGVDSVRDRDGDFNVVEVYFTDECAAMIRSSLSVQDVYAVPLSCDCYAQEGRFENGRRAKPGTHDRDCISQAVTSDAG